MKTAYGVRHQAAGLLPIFFAEKPNDEQMSFLARVLSRRHGEHHPKTKEPWFLKIVEVPLLEASDDISSFGQAPASDSKENEAGQVEFGAQGEGRVKNRG